MGVLNVLLLLGGGHLRGLMEMMNLQLQASLSSGSTLSIPLWTRGVAASQEVCSIRDRSPWGILSVKICVRGTLI